MWRIRNFHNNECFDGQDIRSLPCRHGNFMDASLCEVDARNVDFYKANAARADFTKANLVGASFFCGQWLFKAKFCDVNARGVNFSWAELGCVDFSGADLTGVCFDNAYLRDAKFVGANLVGASFKNACIQHADFQNANLAGVNLNIVSVDKTRVSWWSDREKIFTDDDILAEGLIHVPGTAKE